MKPSLRFGLLPFVARLLIASEFLIAVNGKISGWSGQAAYMAAHGMRFIQPLLAAALAIELVGSLCLITGYHARVAAGVMCLYLGVVSVTLHDFWNQSGMAAGGNETQFFKNLGMMGGLLMIAVYGPGSYALRRRGEPGATGGSAIAAARGDDLPARTSLARRG
jgi:putative oxidoreductase